MNEKENIFYDLRYDYGLEHGSLTIEALAKELGVDKSTISRLENTKPGTEKRKPSIDLLTGYHKKFHVTYEYLLGETNVKGSENIDIGRELGLSDNAIETLKELKKYPEIMSLVNEYLGQREKTVFFFYNLSQYLYAEFCLEQQLSELNSNDVDYERMKELYESDQTRKDSNYNFSTKPYYRLVVSKIKKIFERQKKFEESIPHYAAIDDEIFKEIMEPTADSNEVIQVPNNTLQDINTNKT